MLLHVFLVVYLIAGTFLWQLHGLATFPFIRKMEPILVTPSGAIGTTELASPEGQICVCDGARRSRGAQPEASSGFPVE